MNEKFFITGNTGFIGSWLMKEMPNATGLGKIDIRDYKAVREAVLKAKPTHVIHLAAIANPETCEKQPELAWNVNVKGTDNILRICKEEGIKATIMSTALVYKEKNTPLRENDEVKTNGNTYERTKTESENLARQYGAIIIRAFNQEGPGRPNEYFTSKVILSALNGTEFELWNPHQVREYMDVRDGIKEIHLISTKGKGIINLSTGQGISKLEYLKLVENTLGKEIKYKITKDEDKGTIIGDNTKLKKLGWTQKYTIEQTIKDQARTLQ